MTKWRTERTSTATILGGLHPVHLGDLLDGSRYKVVHKLGHCASSTVWLARDRSLRKYVDVKIKESDISNSKLQNELDILKHLSRATSDHPGRIYSAASLLLRYFWIDGPNGRHLALVFQVLGPSISQLNHWLIRLHTCLARNIVLQVTQGLEYLIRRVSATAILPLRSYSFSSATLIHGPSTNYKRSWAHRRFR